MAVIDDIEPDECAKRSPVRLHDTLAEKKTNLRQTLFEFVERFKKFAAGNLIWPLARGETSSVNAVVYIVVQKGRKLRVLGFDVFWKEIEILVCGEIIEHIVEHSANVVLAIVDNAFCFFVPEDRHRHALIEMGISCLISFAQKLETVNGIN